MADVLGKKISELAETTDLAGLYTIGSDRNNQSKKVPLQFVKEAADYANAQGDYAKGVGDTIQGNTGVNEYPAFSSSTQYAAGSVVRYNNKLYRFTALHPAGAWVGTDAIETSIKAETDVKLTELESQVIYDVSANNDGATFTSLSALLSSENLSTLIPTAVRCGGMSIRFVQSSDNKYVQYRLMSDTFNTTVANWQGVDNEPTAGSNNLVKSGGAYSFVDITPFEDTDHTNIRVGNKNTLLPGLDDIHISQGHNIGNSQIWNTNVDIDAAPNIDIEGKYKGVIRTTSYSDDNDVIALYNSSNEKILNVKRSEGKLLSSGLREYTIYFEQYPTAKYLHVAFWTPSDVPKPPYSTSNIVLFSAETVTSVVEQNTKDLVVDFDIYKGQKNLYLSNVDVSGATPIDITGVENICIHTNSYTGTNVPIELYNSSNEKILGVKREEGKLLSDNTFEFLINLSDYPTAKYIRWGYYNPSDMTAPLMDNVFIKFYLIKKTKDIVFNDTKSPAPQGNIEYFGIEVDCNLGDQEDNIKDSTVQNVPNLLTDRAAIRLPNSYSFDGTPTKLIILNHGAGGMVTENYSEVSTKLGDILASCGFAIMEVNGIPADMTTNINIFLSWSRGLNMGGKIALRSIKKAYDYVVTKYNIDKSGAVVLGRSMGGLCAMNLANSGIVPVRAIALDAPVLDIRNDAYESGDWATGSWGTAGAIAYIYAFDNCNFINGTYSVDGYPDQLFSAKNRELLSMLYNDNINKMRGFNPIINGKFVVDNNVHGINLKAPLMIWHGATDEVNKISISRELVSLAKNGGSIATMRTVPTSHHVVWDYTGEDEGEDYSVTFNGITGCSPYGVELANFILSLL